jgi:hypothetical protein
MLKWIWKLYQGDNSLWAQVISAKYAEARDIFSGTSRGGSPFWKALHKIKHFFKLGARHQVRDGRRTQFWLDSWVGPRPLRDQFPTLFSICDHPNISVEAACSPDRGIRFRRTFNQLASYEWRLLQPIIDNTILCQGQDAISWGLDPSGVFTVNSMYNKLSQGASVAHFKEIWAA